MKQVAYLYLALLAILVDMGAFASTHLLMPLLADQFETPNGINALILAGGFLLLCAGVFLFRKLVPTPGNADEWLSRGWRVVLALIFGVVVGLAVAWQLGFFDSALAVDTRELGEGGSASYFVFGPGAILAFSFLYVLVLAFSVEPSIQPEGPTYAIVAFLALTAVDTMLLVLSSQIKALSDFVGAPLWVILVVFLLLAVLFLPPRLLYLSRTSGRSSPATYGSLALHLLLIAIFATQAVVTIF